MSVLRQQALSAAIDCAAWNYYPPIVADQKAQANKGQLPPRLHAHADMDVLTLLYQREGKPLSQASAKRH